MRKFILAALSCAALLCGPADAQTVKTLTWAVPTTRADGSALAASAIASSQIFDAVGPGAPNPTFPTTPIGTIAGPPTTATLSFATAALPAGTTHTFMVITVDTAGNKSAQSNLVSVTIPLAGPAAITDLKVN